MRRLRPGLIAVALLLGCHVPASAQDARPPRKKPELQFDPVYENDPCGNQARESDLWLSVAGKVVEVTAGDRFVIDVAKARGRKAQRGVVVRLVGIEAPAPSVPFGRESRRQLESLALGRAVSVLTEIGLAYRDSLPGEIVGVAHLRVNSLDLNLEQVRAGLARHKDAAPYTMSNYAKCQYKRAEGEARAARRGLWRQSGVTK